MLNYQDRDWLVEHYVNRRMGMTACARASGHGVKGATVRYWLVRHGIPTRGLNDHMRGDCNPRLGTRLATETREKISKAAKGRRRTEESRQKQSRAISGMGSHRYGKPRTHGRLCWVVQCDGDEPIPMRSRWEVYFADWLCDQGRQWAYEPETFILPDGSAYTPDFLSEGIFYEVKGWLSDREGEKIRLFRESNPHLRLMLLGKDDLIALGINVRVPVLPLKHIKVSGPRTKVCPTCKGRFIPAFKVTVYCSRACVPPRPRNLVKFTCPVCGKIVSLFPSALKFRTTCSAECGRKLGASKRSGANHWSRNR